MTLIPFCHNLYHIIIYNCILTKQVTSRVNKKLTGRDFGTESLDVPEQVQRLINQATSHENLCQCWIGWCPFW